MFVKHQIFDCVNQVLWHKFYFQYVFHIFFNVMVYLYKQYHNSDVLLFFKLKIIQNCIVFRQTDQDKSFHFLVFQYCLFHSPK